MDPRLLAPDEFNLECELRLITGDYSTKLTQLGIQLDDEVNGVRAVPDRTHDAAYHNPDRELRKCQYKLNEHSDWFKRVKDTDPNPHELAQAETRLFHVRSRLNRLKKSRAYGKRAAQLEDHTNDLLIGVQAWIQGGEGQLNETIDKICASTPYEVGNITDSEADEASSDENENDDNKLIVTSSDGQMRLQTSSPIRTVSALSITTVNRDNQIDMPTTSNTVVTHPTVPVSTCPVQSSQMHFVQQKNKPVSIPTTIASSHVRFQTGSYQVSTRSTATAGRRIPLTVNQMIEQLHPVVGSQSDFASQGFVPSQALPTIEELLSETARPRHELLGNRARQYPFPPNLQPRLPNLDFQVPIINNDDNLYRVPPPPINRTRSQLQASRDHQSLSRCKLIYDGSPGGIPIESFLFRLERTAVNFGMARELLVDEIACVLKGVAHEWYWCHLELNPIMTWERLRADIIDRFQDRRTPFDIRRSIENRKQQRNESIIEFYNAIRVLTLQSRVTFPETEILHYVRSNMRSGLQLALADRNFNSISELLQSCISLEDTWTRLKHVPEQPTTARRYVNEINLVDAEISTGGLHPPEIPESFSEGNYCLPPMINDPSVNALDYNKSRRALPGVSEGPRKNYPSNDQKQVQLNYCWNCYNPDHVYQNCPLPPQHFFCYGCGRVGVVRPKCSRCTPGNSTRGNRQFGNPTSPESRQTHNQEDVATNTDPELSRRQN